MKLRAQTEHALVAAEALKKNSTELVRAERPASYQALVRLLEQFADQHGREAALLQNYLSWLNSKDSMAPGILFTYRVWGSTRMSDRSISMDPDPAENPSREQLEMCTEIVFGLRHSGHITYDITQSEIAYEMWENTDFAEVPGDRITVRPSRTLARARPRIFSEFSTYFTELRDSLRNILLEIEKFEEQRHLFHSESFWRDFILKAASAQKSETLLWDFKETLTYWHVKTQPDKDHAKFAFAEEVASLANSAGGVLVVGVTDDRKIVGVSDSVREIENRLKSAADVIANKLEYPREIVRFIQVSVPAGADKKRCLVIAVAQTAGVAAVQDSDGRYTYPERRETGIARVPRTQIMGKKAGFKRDNWDFLHALRQFVTENSLPETAV